MDFSGKIQAATSLFPGNRSMAHLIGSRLGPRILMENFLTAEHFLPLQRFEPLIDQSVAGR